MTPRELKLHIVVEGPPAGVDFGLQKGRGSAYETVQKQRSAGKDLRFEFTVTVKANAKDKRPDYGAPYVQGPAGERFVYIDIGTMAGQAESCWTRRLKIPLGSIGWALVDQAADAGLETKVKGMANDGGPNCGTAKPFEGWKIAI